MNIQEKPPLIETKEHPIRDWWQGQAERMLRLFYRSMDQDVNEVLLSSPCEVFSSIARVNRGKIPLSPLFKETERESVDELIEEFEGDILGGSLPFEYLDVRGLPLTMDQFQRLHRLCSGSSEVICDLDLSEATDKTFETLFNEGIARYPQGVKFNLRLEESQVTSIPSKEQIIGISATNCYSLRKIASQPNLRIASLNYCYELTSFGDSPLLETLEIGWCPKVNVGSLENVISLSLINCDSEIHFGDLTNLQSVWIMRCPNFTHFGNLDRCVDFRVFDCENFSSVGRLGLVEIFEVTGSDHFTELPELQQATYVKLANLPAVLQLPLFREGACVIVNGCPNVDRLQLLSLKMKAIIQSFFH